MQQTHTHAYTIDCSQQVEVQPGVPPHPSPSSSLSVSRVYTSYIYEFCYGIKLELGKKMDYHALHALYVGEYTYLLWLFSYMP